QSGLWNQLVQESETLSLHLANKKVYTCRVAAGPVETGDKPQLDWVVTAGEHDRNCRRRLFGCQRGPDASRRTDDADLRPKQVDDECRQSIVLTLGPAIFDGDVLPFDVSALLQSLMECCECIGGLAGGPTAEKADHRHGRLLPPGALHLHREQQTAAADQGNELAPSHVEHGLPSRNPLCQLTARSSGCTAANCARSPGRLLNLQSELLDCRRPLILLALNVSCIFFRRAGDRISAFSNDSVCHFFGFYRRAKRPLEPLDDGAGRSSGRRQSKIKHRLEPRRPGRGGRRNMGKGSRARVSCLCYGVHFPRLDVAARRRYRIESKRHMATD